MGAGNENVDTVTQFDRNWLKPISTNWIFVQKPCHVTGCPNFWGPNITKDCDWQKCNFQATFDLRKFVRMSKFLRSRSRKARRGSDDNQLAAEEGGSPAKDRLSKKLNLIRFWNCCCGFGLRINLECLNLHCGTVVAGIRIMEASLLWWTTRWSNPGLHIFKVHPLSRPCFPSTG